MRRLLVVTVAQAVVITAVLVGVAVALIVWAPLAHKLRIESER